MSFKHLIIASCLFALPVQAEEPLACQNDLAIRIAERIAEDPQPDNPDTIQLEAGRLDAQLGDAPSASLSGGILLRRGERLAGADSADFEGQSRSMFLEGNVRYQDSSNQIRSDTARFEYDGGRIDFTGAEFALGNNARGAADRLLISQDGMLQLDQVSYTTCPPGSPDWVIEARDIDLDTQEGVGTARGMKLRFKGVPILWAPILSFPISDARKSGILTPEVGNTSRSGTQIRVPYYWNIAPNYDATITPRLLTDRGLQVQTEFRYLTDTHDGIVTAEYLHEDSLTSSRRTLVGVDHQSLFANRIRGVIDYRQVSDSQYFEDLGGSLSEVVVTNLNQALRFDYHTRSLSLLGQVQDFQTIDDAIVPSDEPYRRVPQLRAAGFWPQQWLGSTVLFDAEVVNFDRDVGVTGWRFNVAPELRLPFEQPGWYVTPAVAFDYTSYELSNTEPGQRDNPSRGLPIASLDTGLVFERLVNGGEARRIATIEPRLLYVSIPFEDQSDLPVFDTITPDLNIVQLFRRNRFLGVDRIADTDQLSLGISSRILDVSTGRELVTATIGQTRYFTTSQVSLPGEEDFTDESSDYIAELRFLLYENLNFDFGYQWGTGDKGTTRSEARLQYRPSAKRIINLAYRFRRDSIEQGDVSWSWPLGKQWNFVGRYNYSFRDREALEQFFGFEYESCCWGLRFVTRRFISTRDGTRDTSFGLQLVLKGMTSVGTGADRLLERGILGYSADFR